MVFLPPKNAPQLYSKTMFSWGEKIKQTNSVFKRNRWLHIVLQPCANDKEKSQLEVGVKNLIEAIIES